MQDDLSFTSAKTACTEYLSLAYFYLKVKNTEWCHTVWCNRFVIIQYLFVHFHMTEEQVFYLWKYIPYTTRYVLIIKVDQEYALFDGKWSDSFLKSWISDTVKEVLYFFWYLKIPTLNVTQFTRLLFVYLRQRAHFHMGAHKWITLFGLLVNQGLRVHFSYIVL